MRKGEKENMRYRKPYELALFVLWKIPFFFVVVVFFGRVI